MVLKLVLSAIVFLQLSLVSTSFNANADYASVDIDTRDYIDYASVDIDTRDYIDYA